MYVISFLPAMVFCCHLFDFKMRFNYVPDWSGTCYVDHIDLFLLLSSSQVLGLKVCATSSGFLVSHILLNTMAPVAYSLA